MFFIVGILLFFLSLTSLVTKNKFENNFMFLGLLLLLLSAFRYSIGIDYFSYAYIFSSMPTNLVYAIQSPLHGEIGFKILIYIFKILNLNFSVFIFVNSMVTMVLFLIPIKKFSPFPIISLTILYYIYYFIYINGAIRQGLAMSICFYAISTWSFNLKNIKLILAILLASTFHVSALVLLISLFLNKIINSTKLKNFSNTSIMLWGVGLTFISLSLNFIGFSDFILTSIPFMSKYSQYLTSQFNFVSILSKLILFILVIILYKSKNNKMNKIYQLYFLLYFIGSIIYFAFSNIPLMSRTLDYFTLFEILLIPALLNDLISYKERLINGLIYLLAIFVLFSKDQLSFTTQEYYYNPGIFNYEYIHVFNKEKRYEIKPIHGLEQYIID